MFSLIYQQFILLWVLLASQVGVVAATAIALTRAVAPLKVGSPVALAVVAAVLPSMPQLPPSVVLAAAVVLDDDHN